MSYGCGKRGNSTPPVQLTSDQWQHVAVVCDGSNSIFYVDGMEKGRGAAKGDFAPNKSTTFRLGHGVANRFYRGLLSDVRIYRRMTGGLPTTWRTSRDCRGSRRAT
jgi:hypothetical protein